MALSLSSLERLGEIPRVSKPQTMKRLELGFFAACKGLDLEEKKMVCGWTVHDENVLQKYPLFFLFPWGAFLCVSRPRLAASGSTEGPSYDPTLQCSQLVSAIEDSVRQGQVAGICSSQTKHVCFLFSLFYFFFITGGCTIGLAVLR